MSINIYVPDCVCTVSNHSSHANSKILGRIPQILWYSDYSLRHSVQSSCLALCRFYSGRIICMTKPCMMNRRALHCAHFSLSIGEKKKNQVQAAYLKYIYVIRNIFIAPRLSFSLPEFDPTCDQHHIDHSHLVNVWTDSLSLFLKLH